VNRELKNIRNVIPETPKALSGIQVSINNGVDAG